jgi:hypothetical protein
MWEVQLHAFLILDLYTKMSRQQLYLPGRSLQYGLASEINKEIEFPAF